MAKRFVVDDIDVVIEDDRIEISGEQVNHIKALRHEIGEQVNINNYLVEIKKISKEKIYGVILNKIQPKGIPSKNITLIQSYLKSDKMEYVVQKSVELGVSNVQPVISVYSSFKYAYLAALIYAFAVSINVSFLDCSIYFVTWGIATIISIPKMTITANNSIKVKPLLFFILLNISFTPILS